MSKSKIRIDKITITTDNDKMIELSVNEAKELHSQLNDLFGNTFTPIIIEKEIYKEPYWWPWRWPYYEGTTGYPLPNEPVIISGSNYGRVSSSLSNNTQIDYHLNISGG